MYQVEVKYITTIKLVSRSYRMDDHMIYFRDSRPCHGLLLIGCLAFTPLHPDLWRRSYRMYRLDALSGQLSYIFNLIAVNMYLVDS